jgi:hypothetical protein
MEDDVVGNICQLYHQALHVQRHARQTANVVVVWIEGSSAAAAAASASAATGAAEAAGTVVIALV